MASGWKKDYIRYKSFFLNVFAAYNTKPNFKIYLELILSLTTIVTFAVFAIRPTLLTIGELNNEIKLKQETVSKLKQKVNHLKIASSLLESETDNLLLINESVPVGANPDILIGQMEILAGENLVQILNFAASDIALVGNVSSIKKVETVKTLGDNASELAFTLSVTGTYHDIFNFITSIENLRRPVKIDSIAINSNVTENGKILVFVITGRVPFI